MNVLPGQVWRRPLGNGRYLLVKGVSRSHAVVELMNFDGSEEEIPLEQFENFQLVRRQPPTALAWRDREGDVWVPGDGGNLLSWNSAPFSREYVEQKWGPLEPATAAVFLREGIDTARDALLRLRGVAPTPAPVAVPEGGWLDGDWLVLVDRRVWHVSDDALLHDERGRVVDADYVFRRGYVVYVHAPREDAPRPEPTPQKVHVGVERDTEMGGVSCSECGWHLAGRDTLEADVMEERQRQHDEYHASRPEPEVEPFHEGPGHASWCGDDRPHGKHRHPKPDSYEVCGGRPEPVVRCDTCGDTGRVPWMSEADADGTLPCLDCRPEPVTAPLPNERVLRSAIASVYARHGTRPLNLVNQEEWVDAVLAAGYTLPAPDQRARDEGTVREEIAREIEGRWREHSGQPGVTEHLRVNAFNDALSQAARIARGGSR